MDSAIARSAHRVCALLLLVLLGVACGGCAGPRGSEPADILITPGRYGAAFDAARESLIDLGFELERVDARLGIITSRPKSTAGLASPWDREQSTPMQEVEEVLNRHLRRAIVVFRLPDVPEHAAPVPQTVPGAVPTDLREVDEPLLARVEVILERQRRPGWRLEPTALRFSGRTMDPELCTAGMWPSYNVAFSQDRRLAAYIAGQIRAAAP